MLHAQSLQSCTTLFDFMESLPGSSVPGILQARKLEWVAMPFSRWLSWPRERTHNSCISCLAGRFFIHWATWEGLGNANQNHNEIPYHNHIWFDNSKWCGEGGVIRALIHCCGWDCKRLQQLWKPVWLFLKLLSIGLPLLDTCPR